MIRIIAHRYEPHRCNLPGWRQRQRLGIKYGSIVECETCNQWWEWDNYEGSYWRRIYASERAEIQRELDKVPYTSDKYLPVEY